MSILDAVLIVLIGIAPGAPRTQRAWSVLEECGDPLAYLRRWRLVS